MSASGSNVIDLAEYRRARKMSAAGGVSAAAFAFPAAWSVAWFVYPSFPLVWINCWMIASRDVAARHEQQNG